MATLGELAVLPGSLVLPKVEGPGDLAFVDRLLGGVEARTGRVRRIGVQALIETAAGLAHVLETARMAGERLEALVLGYADLAASLGLAGDAQQRLDRWLPAQHAVLIAARSAGVRVDVWTINDPARMREVLDLGADAVMTDRPEELAKILARRAPG